MKGIIFLSLFGLALSSEINAGTQELIDAVLQKECELVRVELEKGSLPNISFKDVRNNNEIPLIFVSTANVDECTTRQLIKYGANIDQKIILGSNENNMFTATPLISAIRFNQDEAVELILSFKPNTDPKDNSGKKLMDHPLIFPSNFVTSRSIRIKQLLNDYKKYNK